MDIDSCDIEHGKCNKQEKLRTSSGQVGRTGIWPSQLGQISTFSFYLSFLNQFLKILALHLI